MHNLSDNEINVAFRRLKGSSWSTILARMTVYGLRPYEAFTGKVRDDWYFEIPDTLHRKGREVPPKFCEALWLDRVNHPLPSITAKTNRDFAVRTNQAFRRKYIRFSPSDLRRRWVAKLLVCTNDHRKAQELLGVSAKTIATRLTCDDSAHFGEGYLYVLQHSATGLFKIGVTRVDCKDARFKHLGVGDVNSLTHLHLSCRYKEIERELHSKYKSKRVPQTEYFMLTKEDLAAIQTYAPN